MAIRTLCCQSKGDSKGTNYAMLKKLETCPREAAMPLTDSKPCLGNHPGPERLLKRLQAETSNRPLLQTANPETALNDLFSKRQPLYAEADLHLEVGDEEPNQVALKILKTLANLLNNPEV